MDPGAYPGRDGGKRAVEGTEFRQLLGEAAHLGL